MTYTVRAEVSRTVIAQDGVDRFAFNDDGSFELLTPAANPTGNKVPTAGQLPDLTLTAAAPQAATSGTFKDFTGIPSTAKRITCLFQSVSLTGASLPMLQLGTSSGVETSGYIGSTYQSNTTNAAHSSGILANPSQAAGFSAIVTITLHKVSGNTWMAQIAGSYAGASIAGGGEKTLSGVLDRVRFTTLNGTDQFDAGTVNVMWE